MLRFSADAKMQSPLSSLYRLQSLPLFNKPLNDFSKHLSEAFIALRSSEQSEDCLPLLRECIEPTALLDASTSMPSELNEKAAVFLRLNAVIKKLDRFVNEKREGDQVDADILERFSHLLQDYLEFRGQVIKLGKDKFQSIKIPSAIQSFHTPYHYFDTHLASKIAKQSAQGVCRIDAEFPELGDYSATSRRENVESQYRHRGLYVKAYEANQDEANLPSPGVSNAMQQLFQLLTPLQTDQHPMTDTLLVREEGDLKRAGKVYAMQVSAYAGEERLSQWLGLKQNKPPIDINNFATHVILSLLTSQGVVNPESYSYTTEFKNGAPTKIHLVNVDYSNPFTPAFDRQVKDSPRLKLKNILLCFPEMRKPLDQVLANHLSKFSTERLVLEWFRLVYQQNIKNKALADDCLLSSDASGLNKKNPQLESVLRRLRLAVGFNFADISKMCQRFEVIKTLLKEKKTLWDIFAALEPAAALYYEALLANKQQLSLTDIFNERIIKLPIDKVRQLFTAEQRSRFNTALELIAPPSVGTQSLLELCDRFLYSVESSEKPRQELEHISLYNTQLYFAELQKPVFANNDWLTDDLLERFLTQRFTVLNGPVASVTLRNCTRLTQAGLETIIKKFPMVKFGVSYTAQIKPTQWYKNTELPQEAQVYIIYKDGQRCALGNNNHSIALQAVTLADEELILFLLDKLPAAILKSDENGNTVLHHACQHGKVLVVSRLIAKLPKIMELRNKDGDSALDVLIRQSSVAPQMKYKIFIKLLTASEGEIRCRAENGEIMLQLYLDQQRHRDTPKLKPNEHPYLNRFGMVNHLFSTSFLQALSLTTLTEIVLGGNAKIAYLAELVKLCQAVQSVDVSNWNGIKSLSELNAALAGNHTPISLHFSLIQANELGLVSLDTLDTPLQSKEVNPLHFTPALREISFLSVKALTPARAKKLIKGFSHHPFLKRLILPKINIGMDVMRSLISALESLTGIEVLNLNECMLRDKEALLISQFLTKSKQLEVLELDKNDFTGTGITHIANSLTDNLKLRVLSLYGNKSAIPLTAFQALVSALTQNTSLQKVNLNQCQLPVRVLDSLILLLQKQSERTEGITLMELDIGHNWQYQDVSRSLYPLVKALKELKESNRLGNLKYISFGGNKIADPALLKEIESLGLFKHINHQVGELQFADYPGTTLPLTVEKLTPEMNMLEEASKIDEQLKQKWKSIKENISFFKLRYLAACEKNHENKATYDKWYQHYAHIYDPIIQGVSTYDVVNTKTDIEIDIEETNRTMLAHQQRDAAYLLRGNKINEKIALVLGVKRKKLGMGLPNYFEVVESGQEKGSLFTALQMVTCLEANETQSMVCNHITGQLDYFKLYKAIHHHADKLYKAEIPPANVDIVALMKVLNRPIVVIDTNGSVTNQLYLKEMVNLDNPVFILDHGRNHYDALTVLKGFNGRKILDNLLRPSIRSVGLPAGLFRVSITANDNSFFEAIAKCTHYKIDYLRKSTVEYLIDHTQYFIQLARGVPGLGLVVHDVSEEGFLQDSRLVAAALMQLLKQPIYIVAEDGFAINFADAHNYSVAAKPLFIYSKMKRYEGLICNSETSFEQVIEALCPDSFYHISAVSEGVAEAFFTDKDEINRVKALIADEVKKNELLDQFEAEDKELQASRNMSIAEAAFAEITFKRADDARKMHNNKLTTSMYAYRKRNDVALPKGLVLKQDGNFESDTLVTAVTHSLTELEKNLFSSKDNQDLLTITTLSSIIKRPVVIVTLDGESVYSELTNLSNPVYVLSLENNQYYPLQVEAGYENEKILDVLRKRAQKSTNGKKPEVAASNQKRTPPQLPARKTISSSISIATNSGLTKYGARPNRQPPPVPVAVKTNNLSKVDSGAQTVNAPTLFPQAAKKPIIYTSLATLKVDASKIIYEVLLPNSKHEYYSMFDLALEPDCLLINACISSDLNEVQSIILAKQAELERSNLETSAKSFIMRFSKPNLKKQIAAFINEPNSKRNTALHAAVCEGNEEIVKLLIGYGADINAVNRLGYTALHMAIKCNQKELVKLLLTMGADRNTKAEFGRTPLHIAAYDGRRDIVYQLLTEGVEQYGVCDINAQTIPQAGSQTPLEMAIFRSREGSNVSTVELLILSGADCNIQNINNEPLIMVALDSNDPEMFKVILKYLYLTDNKRHLKEDVEILVDLIRLALKRKQIEMLRVIKEHPLTKLLFAEVTKSSTDYKSLEIMNDLKSLVTQLDQQLPKLMKESGETEAKELSREQEIANYLLQTTGLHYQPTPPDGRCLFHALAYYIPENTNAMALRHFIAAHLRANLADFQNFISLSGGQQIEEYLRDVENGKDWPDNIEIEVLMRVLNRPIVIVNPYGKFKNAEAITRFTGDVIFVYYNDHNHYDALLLKPGENGRDLLNRLLSAEEVSALQQLIKEAETKAAQAKIEQPSMVSTSSTTVSSLKPSATSKVDSTHLTKAKDVLKKTDINQAKPKSSDEKNMEAVIADAFQKVGPKVVAKRKRWLAELETMKSNDKEWIDADKQYAASLRK